MDLSETPTWSGVGAGLSGTYEAANIDGEDMLYAYTTLGEGRGGPVLVVGLPSAAVFSGANQSLLRATLFLIGVALVAMLATALFGERFLIRPLRSLANASRRLAGGDLTVRSGIAGHHGEVGALAGAFDRMAGMLEQRERAEQHIEAELMRKVTQLNALHSVFSRITERLNTEDVVHAALDQAAQLVDAEIVVLRLLKGDVLEVAGSVSRQPDVVLDLSPVQLGNGLMGQLAETGKSIRVEQDVSRLMGPGQGIRGAQSGLAVPVMIHGNILGTVGCWSLTPSAFSTEDQQLLEMLATQIAAAIAAASSREASERLARVDTLTGLPNRLQLAEDEASIVRSVESQPMLVAMIDIDRFKRFNDEMGHLFGDRVLREVASSLRTVLRSTDHVYRFGGEEFLVVAPCDSQATAGRLAERLRRAVEQLPMSSRTGEKVRSITVSVGVTLCDSGEDALPAAIERADEALYQAKRTGRNRVVIWSDNAISQSAA
jgi:diguanylate cyclase (GGDEF)-like protein